jgi:HEXXH motif-containing protein
VLRTPAVHAWAQLTATTLAGTDSGTADVGRLATIALAAAIRSRQPCEIDIPGPGGSERSINLPTLGRAVSVPLNAARIRASVTSEAVVFADGNQIAVLPRRLAADARGWLASRTISATHGGLSINVRIDDLDPYRFPDGVRPAGRLDAQEADWWQSQLTAAWRILTEYHHPAAVQIAAAVNTLCPLVSAYITGVSAANRVAPGCIGLSRPVDDLSLALTLVHEVQHVKLAALLDLVPMVEEEALTQRHYAPWRDDARPLTGLLQGVFAHMAIADFWRVQRHLPADESVALHAQLQFARWAKAASDTTAYLCDAPGLTTHGRQFVEHMRAHMRCWRQEKVPEHSLELARRLAIAHRARWENSHGPGSGIDVTEPRTTEPHDGTLKARESDRGHKDRWGRWK